MKLKKRGRTECLLMNERRNSFAFQKKNLFFASRQMFRTIIAWFSRKINGRRVAPNVSSQTSFGSLASFSANEIDSQILAFIIVEAKHEIVYNEMWSNLDLAEEIEVTRQKKFFGFECFNLFMVKLGLQLSARTRCMLNSYLSILFRIKLSTYTKCSIWACKALWWQFIHFWNFLVLVQTKNSHVGNKKRTSMSLLSFRFFS